MARSICATRRLLKTLATDQRHVVAAGDACCSARVDDHEGIIERVEPRSTVLSRAIRGRQQILVTNVDQLLIVASAAEPYLKPNLIDRFLISAHKTGLRPIICINKIDLVEPARWRRWSASTARWATRCCCFRQRPASASIGCAARWPAGPASWPDRAAWASRRCSTRSIRACSCASAPSATKPKKAGTRRPPPGCCRWPCGGYVVDTPGHPPVSIVGRDPRGGGRLLSRPAALCQPLPISRTARTRTRHDCAVKDAVADGRLDERRYESYCHLLAGEME